MSNTELQSNTGKIIGEIVTDEQREAELIEQAALGSTEAFGEIIRQYERFVYNVAYQIVKSREDALDVAQDTFLKIYRSISSFRGDCRFTSWIYRIASNTAKDYLRSQSLRKTDSLYETDEDGDERPIAIPDSDTDLTPEGALDKKTKIEAVRSAISSLPDKYRDIVVLRDMEGRSYEEISEMLSLEIGTVKSRLNRARQAIKDYIISRNFL